jgi:hypothetical protein
MDFIKNHDGSYLEAIETNVRRYPMEAMGIGLLAGFVVGGGQHVRLGRELIGLAARAAVRYAAMTALSQTMRRA